jgi:hypothetical protein
MKARFEIAGSESQSRERSLVYRRDEYSFDTLPCDSGIFTSVLLDDLEIELEASGRVIEIRGLCPYPSWEARTLVAPEAKPGSLRLVCDQPLEKGVSYRLNEERYLPVLFDERTGWVQVKGEQAASEAVAIFPGVIFELTDQGEVSSLWLRPTFEIEKRKNIHK